jgi:cytochrome d ubiquinol oxidase subunit II
MSVTESGWRWHAGLRPSLPSISRLAAALLVFLIVVLVIALAENLPVMDPWLERPYLLVFPAIGALAAKMLVTGVHR